MIGRTLGHYEIVALLGRGGMGEVYRARDTRHKRDVALKLLPEAMAADAARLARFQREAETVASLNHPHIVTLYSVEEAEGHRFITMELVEGQTLDAMLAPAGLPIARVLEIGVAVADALAAAHAQGIVHRDLKPGNVMIANDGRIKVLDFGLAKLAPELTSRLDTRADPLTQDGTVMGTIPYMSPEQVRGEPLDARSDIFSLGTMLYQMATGALPFRGGYDHATAYAIVNEKPEAVTKLRPDAPAGLEHIILQCLEKNPARRPLSARAVRDDLRAPQSRGVLRPPVRRGKRTWIGVSILVLLVAAVAWFVLGRHTAPVEAKSIAVLPFVNMSSDKDQEYFSDGISEELLNLLAQVQSLKVAARTSSFSFKDKDVEIPEIARQLNVTHVLEGSVRKSGDRVRITAQLIHASDGYQLWSHTYDRTLNDIFAVQDEIAADVVAQLKVTLLGEAPRSRKTDPQAYALYMQAKQVRQRLSPDAFAKADSLLRLALKIDPGFAPAWDELSLTLQMQAITGSAVAETAFAEARATAQQALKLDPNSAQAYASMGRIAIWADADFATAAPYLEKALALDPTDSWVLAPCGLLLRNLGRVDQALTVLTFAIERDPVNPATIHLLADVLALAGRPEDAIRTYETALSLTPGRGQEYFGIGAVKLRLGDARGALASFEKDHDELFLLVGRALAYHALNRPASSDSALAVLHEKYKNTAPYNIAGVHAFRGENDDAFTWLDRAVQYKDAGLSEVVFDEFMENIHSDPRWLPFMRKIGKAPEQLEKIQFKVTLPTEPGKAPS